MSELLSKAQAIAAEFEMSDEQLNKCVEHFRKQVKEGLAQSTDRGLPMIPTFVTSIPDGTEKGTFLAVDLGGTNLRVCSVELHGDSTYTIKQEKWPIPHEIMVGSVDTFWELLADHIYEFLATHHDNVVCEDLPDRANVIKMGFTFSFPVTQTALNKGTLLRWTKGFDIKELVGQDVCKGLQDAIDKRKMPVHVAALVNDTVGTLMTRAYTKPTGGRTLVGAIFGTGTNGAYSEQIKHIPKFDAEGHPEITSKIMVINTEWGSFDNDLEVMPNTRFDIEVNKNTPNPGHHMFEKRVSGMFLGELLRLTLVELHNDGLLFKGQKASQPLATPWAIDTSIPSYIHGDESEDLAETAKQVKEAFGYDTSKEERQAIQTIVKAIGSRSAHLSAVPFAGLILHTRALEKFDEIDLGCDGSVVEFYPNFEKMVREALRKTEIGKEESRITLGIAKDGSGVGAALCALVA